MGLDMGREFPGWQPGLGWAIATLLVAGYTGLVRHNKAPEAQRTLSGRPA